MDKEFRFRISIIFFFLLIFCSAVIIKSGKLMLLPSARLEATLERQFREAPAPQPLRGIITDRNHEPLAMSVRVRSLYANPQRIQKKQQLANKLAKILRKHPRRILDLLKQDKGFVWIKRHLSTDEEKQIQQMLDDDRRLNLLLGFAKESKRIYPNGKLSANVLGFTGIDGKGLEGVEYQFDQTLAGEGEANPGKTIVLTIDKATQSFAEQELRAAVETNKAKSGVLVVMDAENGDVWAMASYPTYDPNHFRKSTPDSRRNRPVTETFEPGSTIKALLVAGGLEEEMIGSRSRFYCEEGRMQIGKHWISESSENHKWKWLSVAEILKYSSNIGATKIGIHLGRDVVHRWYRQQGFGERTGIELPGEARGALKAANQWSDINFSNITFGQGMSVTAIQMISAFATIANGGFKVRPRILASIKNDGHESSSPEPIHLERILSASTVRTMTNMLQAVTSDDGTGSRGAVPGFRIAGKTGTAQIATPGKGYTDGKYITSFAGFAIDTKPRFVAYIAIREPQGEMRSGGGVAAPVFARVLSATLARAGVAPTSPASKPEMQISEIRSDADEEKYTSPTRLPQKLAASDKDKESIEPKTSPVSKLEKMPNLAGLTGGEVLSVFSKQNINLRLEGSGIVTKFYPKEGDPLLPKQKVQVYFSPESKVVQ